MSATATLPQQQCLVGIPPAPQMLELRFSLVGQMHQRAQVRMSADGQHACLVVQFAQPAHGGRSRRPVVAIYRVPGSEVPALEALAARLGTGALAIAICQGIDEDDDRAALRAWHCERITALTPADAGRYLPEVAA